MPIRLGLAGYGWRAKGLARVCGLFPETEITAVCAASEATREKAALDFPNAGVFADYTAMLDSGKVSAVMIETPPMEHAAQAIAALERGIHVLSDVPAVHEIAEAQPLWDAAQGSTAQYLFGATTNFWADIDCCADMIEQGMLGEAYYCEAEYVADLASVGFLPPGSWRKNYPPIRYCTHSLGPVLKWVKGELRSVSCFDTGSHISGDPEDHDAMVALFRTDANAVVKLFISFITAQPVPYHRYLCRGTKGYFEHTQPLQGGEQQVLCASKAVYGFDGINRLSITHERPELAALATAGDHGTADYAMIANLVGVLTRGEVVAVTLREALKMTLPGLYALKSAQAGETLMSIAYPWDES